MTKNNNTISLQALLSDPGRTIDQKLALFAWLSLGIIESLATGHLTPTNAIEIFFDGENCIFVRESLADENADTIMSCGVQLPDLFDILPPEEARLEFQDELSTMRSLCMNILKEKRLAA